MIYIGIDFSGSITMKPGLLGRVAIFSILLQGSPSSPLIAGQPQSVPPASARKPHTVTLTWKASSTQVSGYNIYRKSKTEKEYRKINPSPVEALTYIDNDVKSGATYHYVVRSVDAQGRESVDSHEFTVAIP
jgi:fibronectin type 3 domain-containing protein